MKHPQNQQEMDSEVWKKHLNVGAHAPSSSLFTSSKRMKANRTEGQNRQQFAVGTISGIRMEICAGAPLPLLGKKASEAETTIWGPPLIIYLPFCHGNALKKKYSMYQQFLAQLLMVTQNKDYISQTSLQQNVVM